jgi:hypothetical protein
MSVILHQVTVSIAAANVSANVIGGELDWRRDGVQTRRIVTTLANGADSVLIEGTLDGSTWFTINTAHTGATTPFVDTVTGPYFKLRATKTGTNGAATVVAMV